MRVVVTLCLIIVGAPAWAEWVKMGETEAVFFYVDPTTIRESGELRTALGLQDLKLRHSDGELSRRTVDEFDCKSQRFRTLSITEHSDRMARGRTLVLSDKPSEWRDIVPGSMAKRNLDFVCAYNTRTAGSGVVAAGTSAPPAARPAAAPERGTGANPTLTAGDLTPCRNEISELHRLEIAYLRNEARNYCTKIEIDKHPDNCRNTNKWVQDSSGTSDMNWYLKGNESCSGPEFPCWGLNGMDTMAELLANSVYPPSGNAFGDHGWVVQQCVARLWIAKRDGRIPAIAAANDPPPATRNPVSGRASKTDPLSAYTLCVTAVYAELIGRFTNPAETMTRSRLACDAMRSVLESDVRQVAGSAASQVMLGIDVAILKSLRAAFQ